MLLKFHVKEEKQSMIPAVTHIDGSVRPQTVSSKTNQRYTNLIKEFEKISGVPLIINTSFNLRGEPLVNNPLDAIRSFYYSEIDYLCIDNFLISKWSSNELS